MNITLAFQDLDNLIVEHTCPPVTAMLRNKLHLLRDQTEAYIAEKENVTALLEKTQAENSALKLTLPKDETADYVEHYGAFFKRKADGSYHKSVYCGACRKSVASVPGLAGLAIPYSCKCGWVANFWPSHLDHIMKTLP